MISAASDHSITSEKCAAIKTGTVAIDAVAIMTVVDRSDCCAVCFARAIRDDICTTSAITSPLDRNVANTYGGAYEQLTQHGSRSSVSSVDDLVCA
jgi:hypothetical protein